MKDAGYLNCNTFHFLITYWFPFRGENYLFVISFVILYAQGNAVIASLIQVETRCGWFGSCQVQDEESLVRRAQQHDPAALTQLYEENFDRIYRYVVLKVGDRAEAEDITQQVFLNALKSIAAFKSSTS